MGPDWDDLRVFLAVAREGTLSGAAARLRLGVATVSRRIERLEAALGATLFSRHQSGYRLTDEGAALLARAEAMEAAAAALAPDRADVSGTVRLASAETLANDLVIPSLPELFARHPGLVVEITTAVASVNLHRRDADLALRMVRPERGNVTVRRVGRLGFALFGAPEHVAARRPGALREDDRLIGWDEAARSLPAARWVERAMRDRPPALTTTTLAGQLAAARAGLGLAVLPRFLGVEAGLAALDLELGLDQPIWLAVHADLAASARVRALADHLAELVRRQDARLRTGRQDTGPP